MRKRYTCDICGHSFDRESRLKTHKKNPCRLKVEEIYNKNPNKCKQCGCDLLYDKRKRKFCSQQCANEHISGLRKKPCQQCLSCGTVVQFHKQKYCSYKCQMQYQHDQYIQRWLNGEESGSKGNDGVSKHIRRHLFEQHNNSCEKCGWSENHEITGLVPLHIDHVDGDCHNNRPENLQLLCPNCHSLTHNFGILNKNSTRSFSAGKFYQDKQMT